MVVELSLRRWVLPALSQVSKSDLADQFALFLCCAERRVSKPEEEAANRGSLAHEGMDS